MGKNVYFEVPINCENKTQVREIKKYVEHYITNTKGEVEGLPADITLRFFKALAKYKNRLKAAGEDAKNGGMMAIAKHAKVLWNFAMEIVKG